MDAITTIDQLFMRYDAIGQVVGQMLGAARDDNWDTVIDLQERYSALVDTLRPVDGSFPLEQSQSTRKQDMTRRILSDEATIRELTASRLARLSALLASSRHTRALHETYGMSPRG